MAFEAFLKIVGPEIHADGKQGGDIPILGFSFNKSAPGESPDKGLNPGKKKGTIEFLKEWDEATPKLLTAMANKTRFREMIFSFVRSDSRGGGQRFYYRITAKLPRITKIQNSASGGVGSSSGAKHNARSDQHELETVSIADFQDLVEEHLE